VREVFHYGHQWPQRLLLFYRRAQTRGLALLARGFYFRTPLLSAFHRNIACYEILPMTASIPLCIGGN
jgi:hypothetical protein